jgi:hypothetical protein
MTSALQSRCDDQSSGRPDDHSVNVAYSFDWILTSGSHSQSVRPPLASLNVLNVLLKLHARYSALHILFVFFLMHKNTKKKHVATTECEWLFLFAILAHDQYSYFALCAIILTSSATITTDARTHMTSAH